MSRYLCIILLLFNCVACLHAGAGKPNVILISIDTLRADHLSSYGHWRETSPRLDEIAADSVRFEKCYANSPHTCPSHCSILTSLYPSTHGTANGVPLKDHFVTLAEVLKEEGYATGAVIGGYVLNDEVCGLKQGFDRYYEHSQRRGEKRASGVRQEALEWLEENREENFFIFVHFYDPHCKYDPPSPYNRKFLRWFQPGYKAKVIDLGLVDGCIRHRRIRDANFYEDMYDGEINYTDTHIGLFLDKLREWDLLDDSILVITSDHGESMTEYIPYFAHGQMVYESALRIPLVVRAPGLPRRKVVPGPAQSIDIMPTILELLGIEPGINMQGISLLPYIRGEVAEINDHIFARTTSEETVLWPSGSLNKYSLVAGNWKLIVSKGEGEELFDLAKDPGEESNLIAEEAETASRLRGKLEEMMKECARFRQEKTGESDERDLQREEDLKTLEDL